MLQMGFLWEITGYGRAELDAKPPSSSAGESKRLMEPRWWPLSGRTLYGQCLYDARDWVSHRYHKTADRDPKKVQSHAPHHQLTPKLVAVRRGGCGIVLSCSQLQYYSCTCLWRAVSHKPFGSVLAHGSPKVLLSRECDVLRASFYRFRRCTADSSCHGSEVLFHGRTHWGFFLCQEAALTMHLFELLQHMLL